MPQIHPTAIVDSKVNLADDVVIGPYAVLTGDIVIGAGTVIREHSVLEGSTRIGERCKIGPAAYIGLDPQHVHFKVDLANPTFLTISNNVTIREASAIHRSMKPGIENATKVGDNCFIMGQTHIAHDCAVADNVILANGALVAGHCVIGANAFLGGGCTLHQFCRVGRLVMIAGNEALSRDIPPFGTDRYGGLKGYNAVGCRRAGMSRETIQAVRAAYLRLHTHRVMSDVVAAIRAEVPDLPEVREILEFIQTTKRGIQPSVKHLHAIPNDSED